MRLIVARNGETLWEREHRLQGIQDSALSDEGKKQVDFLAKALKDEKIDAVYCSDMGRCIDSARPIAKSHNLKLSIKTELRQRSHGIVEGMTQKEADKEYPKLQEQRKQSKFQFRNPKGESYADAEKRVLPFLEELKQKHSSQTVCIVTHGGIIRLILGHYLALKPQDIPEIDMPHECIYFVENAESNPSVSHQLDGQNRSGILKKAEEPEEVKVEETDEEMIEKEAEKELEGEEPYVEGQEVYPEGLESEEEKPKEEGEASSGETSGEGDTEGETPEPSETEPSDENSEPEKDDSTVSPE